MPSAVPSREPALVTPPQLLCAGFVSLPFSHPQWGHWPTSIPLVLSLAPSPASAQPGENVLFSQTSRDGWLSIVLV